MQIVAGAVWMSNIQGKRERRLEHRRELRRLRQSGESVVVREGRLERRREQGRRRLAKESAGDRIYRAVWTFLKHMNVK